MKCPYCHSSQTICKDSREKENYIRNRRYECLNCLRRFSTVETPNILEHRTVETDKAIEDMECIVNGADPCNYCDTRLNCPHPASCPEKHYKNFRWRGLETKK